ncbi:unnamed protein product [Caretta caretta]
MKCPSGQRLNQFRLRVEPCQGLKDDTAADNIEFVCTGGAELRGQGRCWGKWGPQSRSCGQRGICTLDTKVEAPPGQGGRHGPERRLLQMLQPPNPAPHLHPAPHLNEAPPHHNPAPSTPTQTPCFSPQTLGTRSSGGRGPLPIAPPIPPTQTPRPPPRTLLPAAAPPAPVCVTPPGNDLLGT